MEWMMKIWPLTFALVLLTAWSAWSSSIPSRWLEGARGYERALELQKQTGQPILVYTLWGACGNCKNVMTFVQSSKVREPLKEYIRVVVDEKGKKDEAELCKQMRFSGGNFYVLTAGQDSPVARIWPWKPDSRIILDDLPDVLKSKLEEAKSSS